MKFEEAIKTNKFDNERHRATLNVLYTSWWLKAQMSAAMKEFGLTTEQFNVMRILKGKHPQAMCVKDIGSRMIEKNSNVPRIMDKLVTKKLVRREVSAEDKRETLHILTEAGLNNLEQANAMVRDLNNEVSTITEEEAAILNELLEKLRVKK